MGRRKKSACCEEQIYDAKSQTNIKEGDTSANMSLLKKKYKNILGSKEPIIVLRNCLLAENLSEYSLVLDNYPLVDRLKNANLINNNDKKILEKSKISKGRKPKHKKEKLNNGPQPPKRIYRKRNKINKKELNFESWKIKYDSELKVKALKDNEKLKICLKKTVVRDKNSNVISSSDELKVFQRNAARLEAEDTRAKGMPKKTVNNNDEIERNQSTYKSLDVNKNEELCSSCVDLDNFSHSAVDLSNTIFSTNYILNKYMTSTETPTDVGIQVLEERDEHKEDLPLVKVNEDKKTQRNLPVIIKEDILHKNCIKLKIKEMETRENCNKRMKLDLKGFDLKQTIPKSVAHNNGWFDMNEKQNSSITSNYVIPKLQRTSTDCDKNTNYEKTVDAINNENRSTLVDNASKDVKAKDLFNMQNKSFSSECNNELDKENSQNTWFSSQFLLTENYKSHIVTNANNSLKYEQEKKKEDTANDTIRYSLDGTKVFKQKRVITNEDTGGQSAKRLKLDRNHWHRSATNVRKMDINVGAANNTTSINELDNKGILQVATSSVNRLNNVSNPGDVVTETDELKSKTDKGIPGFIRQVQIESVQDGDARDCDLLQNRRKSTEVASNVCESFVENQCSISAKLSSREDSMDDQDDENDYISIFADSTLMNEYDSFESSPRDKPYPMTDNLFDRYYKKNQSEFNEMYENNNVENTSKEMMTPVVRTMSTKSKTNVTIYESILLKKVFRGYCYKVIQFGKCSKDGCRFMHNFQIVMQLLYRRNEPNFIKVLEELALYNCTLFIEKIFKETITYHSGSVIYELKLFKKLFELNAVTNGMSTNIIKWLQTGGHSLKVINDQLVTIVNDSDFKFINWILCALQRCTRYGEYWDTFRSLVLKTKHLEPQVIQIILEESIITKKNLQDVHINVISKLSAETNTRINAQLLLTFNHLIKSKEDNVDAKQNVSSESIRSINSPVDKRLGILNKKDTSCTTNGNDGNGSNKEEQSENSSFILHPIDNLPNPHSVHGRKKFWKFYVDVYSLQKGLENNDYDHVINILNLAKKNQQSPFTSACYQILCNEITCSQHHLSKLISHAVRVGTTGISYQILLDVAIQILARLAEKDFWVSAYTLLKDVYVMFKMKINLYQFDAATVMLIAEIYLANRQPVKALNLLKQSYIIFTNRTKWKVRSTMKDDYIRVEIMTFLLESLCPMYPEHAFFLFRLLITDQFSNFYPIDLARFANKMISVLLLRQNNDLIVEFGILIDDYYVLLDAITYRALIASLVHIDMPLAKQLYQNAIALGIYSKPQFHPVTYLIINSDWTNEEMFLAIFNFMKQLSANIGHAIDHISSRHLVVYLVFETIPTEKELNYNTCVTESRKNKIEGSKTLMKNLLKQKFDPPILITKHTNKGNMLRLNNKSVLTYLQSEHYE